MINPVVTNDSLTVVNDFLEIDLSYTDNVAIQVTGTFAGTITFQASNDGTNFVSTTARASTQTAIATEVTTTTGVGMFYLSGAHPELLRITMTAFTSGTAVVDVFTSSIQR